MKRLSHVSILAKQAAAMDSRAFGVYRQGDYYNFEPVKDGKSYIVTFL